MKTEVFTFILAQWRHLCVLIYPEHTSLMFSCIFFMDVRMYLLHIHFDKNCDFGAFNTFLWQFFHL